MAAVNGPEESELLISRGLRKIAVLPCAGIGDERFRAVQYKGPLLLSCRCLALVFGVLTFGLVTVATAENSPHLQRSKGSEHLTMGGDVNLLGFSRGSVNWLGKAWFTREKSAEEIENEEDEEEAQQKQTTPTDSSKAGAPATNAEKKSIAHDLSCTIGNSFIYETKPAKIAGSRPGWRWEGDFSLELDCEVSDTVTITPATGVTFIRHFSQRTLNSEEPYVSLLVAWNVDPAWTASLREESFWDMAAGFGAREFAAHAFFARLKYDMPNPENKSPHRWQFLAEAAQSFAQPSEHDYHGFALGAGHALRLVPQKLTLQTQAGTSYEEYPHFHSETNQLRRGWNTHAATALVWTPSKHVEVSIGIEFMHSAETGRLFRFNDLSVPLTAKFSF